MLLSLLSKIQGFLGSNTADFLGCFRDAVPGGHQLIVGEGVFGPFFSLAHGVQVVSQLANGSARSGMRESRRPDSDSPCVFNARIM